MDFDTSPIGNIVHSPPTWIFLRLPFGFSTYILRRGGRVVICAASSGFNAQIDLRYLWMELKSIIGSHFANYKEAFDAAQLVFDGKIKTEVFETAPIDKLPQMADAMWQRKTYGKVIFTHP